MHSESLIDTLLFEEEGTALDFKRDQYPFANADDRQKSELLKDILAFANTWRRSDAYILIGIEEVRGGPSMAYGVTSHLDDARLQQFVNTKTNRPIEFSYTPMLYRSVQIGIIHVPVQDRPVFLLRDYGPLRRDTVYIRRGSSTDAARPDEIARMGAMVVDSIRPRPLLVPRLSTGSDWNDLADTIEFESVCLIHPPIKELPDYIPPPREQGPFGSSVIFPTTFPNYDFYRNRAKYLRFYSKLRAIRFAVENSGTALASGVKIIAHIDDPDNSIELVLGSNSPKKPKRDRLPIDDIRPVSRQTAPDIDLTRTRTGWIVTAFIGKIQAKDTALSSERLFVGLPSSGNVRFSVTVFADELSTPVITTLNIQFTVSNQEVSFEQLTQ
jgi:hypothetical protein